MLFYLRIAAALLPAAAQGSFPDPAVPAEAGVRLKAAIERAVANNPEIAAMEAKISAARHRVTQADALPDPEIEIGLKDVPVSDPSLTRDSMTMEMIMARQRLRDPGSGRKNGRRKPSSKAWKPITPAMSRRSPPTSRIRTSACWRSTGKPIARETLQRPADAAPPRGRYRREGSAGRRRGTWTGPRSRTAWPRCRERRSSPRGSTRCRIFRGLEVAMDSDAGRDFEPGIAAGLVPASADLIRRAEQESPRWPSRPPRCGARRRGWRAPASNAGLNGSRLTTAGAKAEDMAGSRCLHSPVAPSAKARGEEGRVGRSSRARRLPGGRPQRPAPRHRAGLVGPCEKPRQARLYRSRSFLAEINYRAARGYAVGTVDFLTYVGATDLAV